MGTVSPVSFRSQNPDHSPRQAKLRAASSQVLMNGNTVKPSPTYHQAHYLLLGLWWKGYVQQAIRLATKIAIALQ
ncbi:uncharacterized protein N7515_001213 [Penicillium bovifimosum]|uniref:Uncharacterized protein n=1 Tax=Penicillium bovifimosum TaxID=126998 RepID=A0A9W9L4A8_9EURO|nr:uncharacterized protein N7515_003056 [Penicillium bovifimosum]XP_056524070.1 uncharacterized protein N7515_001213 [Penicillium bovifimosum]KAJ5138208.1 hypothetical protein N7515_003056 [Penicillium bovifimosum]KAJ5142426.1 hypothetical protein N7515_001213 [Penicillium bovifimosum]